MEKAKPTGSNQHEDWSHDVTDPPTLLDFFAQSMYTFIQNQKPPLRLAGKRGDFEQFCADIVISTSSHVNGMGVI
jgi:hypothetical protein